MGLKRTDFSELDRIRDYLARTPLSEVDAIEMIRLNDAAYVNDAYFQVKFGNPNHISPASAGRDHLGSDKRLVDFYIDRNGQSLSLSLQYFLHEFAHLAAIKRYGSSTPPRRWRKAMKKDGRAVSDYAENNDAEDWAESVMTYLIAGRNATNRQHYKHRFEELDNFFAENPGARDDLLTAYAGILKKAGIVLAVTATGTYLINRAIVLFTPAESDLTGN